MAVYLVTWDLNGEKPNYAQARARFMEGFKVFGSEVNYDSFLDSVRFVSTSMSAQKIHDHLKAYMDDTDRLLVSRIYRDNDITQGSLGTGLWDWIHPRM